MNRVILKFGGTSLTSIEKKNKIVEIIKDTIDNKEFPIIVLSAIGRFNEPYATDTLLSLINDKSNLQSIDLLMSCGEIISVTTFVSYLKENNIDAMPLTGGQAGIITDDNYGNANIIDFNGEKISSLINKNIIPIICGFQGITKDGFITTLGRGGSDTTATVLGANLNTSRIEIYKDVDGIMTNDPKVDDKAKLLHYLTYDEAYEIVKNGAKVFHEKALYYAKEKEIPIIIKNLFNLKIGTIISK